MSDPATTNPQDLDWTRVEKMARDLPERHNLVVPKASLPHAPPHRRTWMGRKKGARHQYRCHRADHNLHIKEYEHHWVVHVDRYNPHHKMMLHLLVDRGFKHYVPLFDLPSLERTPVPVAAEE